MAIGDHGPNLAPVLGRVELVFVLGHANAIIQCEYDPCNSGYFWIGQKMFQYNVISILFHEAYVKYRTRKLRI